MTQSRSVWRSMPAACAAASRLMPSSALAIARMRRVMRASLSPLASLRSTVAVRSRRIDSADILPSIESMAGENHEPGADGILPRPQESGVQKTREDGVFTKLDEGVSLAMLADFARICFPA